MSRSGREEGKRMGRVIINFEDYRNVIEYFDLSDEAMWKLSVMADENKMTEDDFMAYLVEKAYNKIR
uniref:Uncharacterized protein n=1 Tax=viral metagenome TaxID=1070528 RepID=A0A6M3LB04_9ZZZZ